MISIVTASGEVQMTSEMGEVLFFQNTGTIQFFYAPSAVVVPVSTNNFDFSNAESSMYLAIF